MEETFARLVELANSLDAEQKCAAEEGLSYDELALFDLLSRERISKIDREKLKQASKNLLAKLQEILKPMITYGNRSRAPRSRMKTHKHSRVAYMTMFGSEARAEVSLTANTWCESGTCMATDLLEPIALLEEMAGSAVCSPS